MTSEPIDLDEIEARDDLVTDDTFRYVLALVARVRELEAERDAARTDVMGELLDARRRAEQAAADVSMLQAKLRLRTEALTRVRAAILQGGQTASIRLRAALDALDGDGGSDEL